MGFVRPPQLDTLQFEGELDGLTVRVRHLTGAGFTTLGGLDPVPSVSSPLPVLPLFLDVLDSWNLTRTDGSCVPCTYDGFMSHDLEFIRAVLSAYVEALGVSYQVQDTRPDGTGHVLSASGGVQDTRSGVLDDAADAEDMDVPTPPGPDLSGLERFAHALDSPGHSAPLTGHPQDVLDDATDAA